MIKLFLCAFPILSTVFFFKTTTTTTNHATPEANEIIETEEFVDARDGEIYKTIMIGDQKWFAENLRYDVPEIVTGFYHVDTILSSTTLKHYGRLYDWNTLMNRNSISEVEKNLSSKKKMLQGICPEAWHVPSDEEWKALERFLGMKEETIEKVSIKRAIPNIEKVVSPVDWVSDEAASSGNFLNIFPTGRYTPKSVQKKPIGFFHLGERATFWTSTENSEGTVWGRTIKYNESTISRYNKYQKQFGYSCRCVED
jgi:uncharacterized protein (TIGR02145 family)